MVYKTSLGICTDSRLRSLLRAMEEKKLIPDKNGFNFGKKRYVIDDNVVHACVNGEKEYVYKKYVKIDGEWYLQTRLVRNPRGSYEKYVTSNPGEKPAIKVSLASQTGFIKQPDGSYLQPACGQFPARTATSKELEAAINYINGKGSAESYTRMLRG